MMAQVAARSFFSAQTDTTDNGFTNMFKRVTLSQQKKGYMVLCYVLLRKVQVRHVLERYQLKMVVR